jgi:hypothetical protein
MAQRKAISAVIILSAAFVAPVFARDAVGSGYGTQSQVVTTYRSNHWSNYSGPYDQNFRGAYNQPGASFYARPLTNERRPSHGVSGRDPRQSFPSGQMHRFDSSYPVFDRDYDPSCDDDWMPKAMWASSCS